MGFLHNKVDLFLLLQVVLIFFGSWTRATPMEVSQLKFLNLHKLPDTQDNRFWTLKNPNFRKYRFLNGYLLTNSNWNNVENKLDLKIEFHKIKLKYDNTH